MTGINVVAYDILAKALRDATPGLVQAIREADAEDARRKAKANAPDELYKIGKTEVELIAQKLWALKARDDIKDLAAEVAVTLGALSQYNWFIVKRESGYYKALTLRYSENGRVVAEGDDGYMLWHLVDATLLALEQPMEDPATVQAREKAEAQAKAEEREGIEASIRKELESQIRAENLAKAWAKYGLCPDKVKSILWVLRDAFQGKKKPQTICRKIASCFEEVSGFKADRSGYRQAVLSMTFQPDEGEELEANCEDIKKLFTFAEKLLAQLNIEMSENLLALDPR